MIVLLSFCSEPAVAVMAHLMQEHAQLAGFGDTTLSRMPSVRMRHALLTVIRLGVSG